MIVLKFGGTSVSSKSNLEQIATILSAKTENFIVVVSAFSGITNKLEQIANLSLHGNHSILLEEFRNFHFEFIKELVSEFHQIELFVEVQQKCNQLEAICESVGTLKELSDRTRATILSFGESLSSIIVQKYLSVNTKNSIKVNLLDSKKIISTTTNESKDYLNAHLDLEKTTRNILAIVGVPTNDIQNKNYIAAGFVAHNQKGETVTLGRGGSDFSAAIYANTIDATRLEIWSDVNGMQSANPRKVQATQSLQKLSYKEAFEMAYFGAKVLYPPSILPVMDKNIPLYLKNTFSPEQEGTFISNENKLTENKIQGICSLDEIAIITVSGVGLAKQKGSARRVFQILEEANINIILITQSSSEQSIGIGINQSELQNAEEALNSAFEKEIKRGLMNEVKTIENQCIVAIVGDNMKNAIGLAGKVFGAIGENGINVTAIAQGASERNISIVINKKDEEKALNVIHEKFFASTVKNVHVFIAGIGNVGTEFINILFAQKQKLIEEYQINLKIIGVANSKKMLFNHSSETFEKVEELTKEDVLKFKQKKENKNAKTYSSLNEYFQTIKELNLRNSVFIDNTASDIVSEGYEFLIKNSISVVTCNKIACSSEYSTYLKLNKLAKDRNIYFKYETSVGAALPILKTIYDLRISGDKINQIEAVISGSLNFIFNNYNAENQFADVVLQAKEEGYTEPNPLIDLSGLDVMRKILILSRESGLNKELSDITFNSFLPDECTNSKSVEELFENLKKNENHFKALYQNAHKNGNKLKVVAKMEKGNLSVALKEIPSNSPFYNLEGKDNVVAINTNRYVDEPLVIKGAGAGAAVTASGVFADLMFIMNN
ncbi:aspartate kinase [Bernardetia litoralis DSM 6794]|uniref:Aspartate kinase n=1 Tax=Bernardetia litoralis (strain ATCC 23117 / DSM 6794 / NBRC 15988 / NCIMB 1366 / Fx l1 / Sio-4) TaxID=880071 RepID=I4AHB3_BERLS|nr:bifunctional aspartate kinase/homoserine dehydrogenase I [Bernardetia litoralis]AFM03348.1 aspartate kinase [Bernardetia litoralis DSM 6794]